MKELIPYSRDVFYYETDQMQIVHHSNYARWFEEARIDFMKQIGVPYDEMEAQDLLIPVLEVGCKFKIPFRFGDKFEIVLKIDKFNGIKMNLSYEVRDAITKEVRSVGTSAHCFVDRNMMPLRIKKERPDIYNAIMEYVE